jgi:hypothetical protein
MTWKTNKKTGKRFPLKDFSGTRKAGSEARHAPKYTITVNGKAVDEPLEDIDDVIETASVHLSEGKVEVLRDGKIDAKMMKALRELREGH